MANKKTNPATVIILVVVILAALALIIKNATKRPPAPEAYKPPAEEMDYWQKRAELEKNWNTLSETERAAMLEELSKNSMDSVVGPVKGPGPAAQ